jgi:hypothetical protein
MQKIRAETAIKLLHIFWPDFIEVDGSIFLASGKPEVVSRLDLGLDRTGMEASANHIHVSYLVNHKATRQPADENDLRFYDYEHPDFQLLCQLGRLLAQMWYRKLKEDFPQYAFRVYYTQEDNPIVRFHRVRSDEPNWLDEKKWKKEIQEGKIIIYDTRHESSKQYRA